MRKNDLISMLQSIKGNPEVMLWNGFVQDCTHISNKVIPFDLVKMNKNYFMKTCEWEEQINRRDWDYVLSDDQVKECLNSYKNHHNWEVNQCITEQDIQEKRYNRKTVVLLQPKIEGKTYCDRLGKMEY